MLFSVDASHCSKTNAGEIFQLVKGYEDMSPRHFSASLVAENFTCILVLEQWLASTENNIDLVSFASASGH